MFRVILLIVCLSVISLIPWSVNYVRAQDEPTITVSDIPPTPGETPEETLDKCLQWYLEAHPVPFVMEHWECHEIVGYYGILTFTAVEGMEDTEPGQVYNVDGTIGEETERTIQMRSFDLNSIYDRQPSDYQIIIEGFERCVPPDLSVDPEQYAIDVGEETKVVVHLWCGGAPMRYNRIVILEVVSGPGEFEYKPLSDSLLLGDVYGPKADKVVEIDDNGRGEATLRATGSGVIEIKATRYICLDRDNAGEVTTTTQVRAGKWISIDCTYASDPGRFGDDALIWGGTIHAEVMLETIEEEVYGYPVTRLGGHGSGSQECWVETSGPDWIENISCPEFTAEVVSGMVWPDVYNFMLDASDTANLTFDIVYNEGDSRLTRSELDPVRAIETPIALGFDPDAVFTITDTDVLGTEYTVEARWME